MSGRRLLPAGEPVKKSQRHARRAQPTARKASIERLPGQTVQWRDAFGVIHQAILRRYLDRDAEIVVGSRVYRVKASELR